MEGNPSFKVAEIARYTAIQEHFDMYQQGELTLGSFVDCLAMLCNPDEFDSAIVACGLKDLIS